MKKIYEFKFAGEDKKTTKAPSEFYKYILKRINDYKLKFIDLTFTIQCKNIIVMDMLENRNRRNIYEYVCQMYVYYDEHVTKPGGVGFLFFDMERWANTHNGEFIKSIVKDKDGEND